MTTDLEHTRVGGDRPPGVGVLPALEGLVLLLWHLAATPFIGRRRLRWGTIGNEARDPLPGDEFVPEAKWSNTLGVAIDALPSDVWPWIAQLGQGRGGFYTYQTLENMVGCKITNTTEILPEHQRPAVGDGIRLFDGGPPLEIKALDPPHAMVLVGSAADLGGEMNWGRSTWQFIVVPGRDGGSRLLTRCRYDFGSGWKSRLMFGRFPLEPISFVMSRRMLIEIKRLAELRSTTSADSSQRQQPDRSVTPEPTGLNARKSKPGPRLSGIMSRLFHRGRLSETPHPETVRSTNQGDVIGLVANNGAHLWRGIPYAASTAGANRWRAPQPVPRWEKQRVSIEFAPRCVQLTNRGDKDDELEPGVVIGSEDCLALDIYAPPEAENQTLPVMVWIHGGGNVWGRSSQYDGSHLAINEDVIVVAIQFRVGPLGWFAHAALRETAQQPEDKAACFAILDQIAALRWVAENIAHFGGDPDCVTIFGESSGGHNVAALLASPLAAGLFHRAIIESGSFDSITRDEAEGLDGELANPSAEIAARLGATTADELRATRAEDLYAAYTVGEDWFLDVPRMIQDGVVLPATPLRDAFTSTATFNTVPIILGTTKDEMKLFFASDHELTTKRFGALLVARNEEFYDAISDYFTRLWRIRAVNEPAAAMAKAGHDEVYSYRFDWDDSGRLLFMDFKKMFGAAHGFEIPFVFNRFEHLGDADRFLFQKRTKQNREALSRIIGRYWASFARDGVPSCPGQPNWPGFTNDGGTYLRLDTTNDGGITVVNDVDTLDRIIDDLRTDPRLDAAERRSVIDEMSDWMFTRPIKHQIQTALGAT